MTSHEPASAAEQLRELVARGFQFVHPCDSDGEVLAVVGIRAHDNVIDVVRLMSEDEVVAARMPGDEQDVLQPSRVTWQSTGEVHSVLTELLELPDDRTPGSLALSGRG
jgi:hypothetical protein